MQFEELTISVWVDKDCEWNVDWRGAVLVVKSKDVTDEEINEFVDKDLMRYFRKKFKDGYVSFTEESFTKYCHDCMNYYRPLMNVRDGLVLKINNGYMYEGNFYRNFIYISRYLNISNTPSHIASVIVHELTHFIKGYKNHVQGFDDKVQEVLEKYGYTPY